MGVLVGLFFNGAAVWADVEAALFDSALSADETLDWMRCPLVITPGETGIIHAYFKNNGDRPVTPTIRAHISEGLVILMRQIDTRPTIQPGETIELQYEVTGEDAVWGAFILARVYMFRSSPLPSRTGSCGILLANIPLPRGWVVVALLLIASVGGIGSGLWLWRQINMPLNGRTLKALQAMIVLALATLAGIGLNLIGIWFPAAVLLLLTILLLASLFAYFMML